MRELLRVAARVAIALLLVLGGPLPAVRAYAGSKVRADGKQEFERAMRFYDAQEYEAALPLFHRAYELSNRRASAIRALAQCERALKRYHEAIAHFREYLATKPRPADASSVEETIILLEQLEREATKAAAAPPQGTAAEGSTREPGAARGTPGEPSAAKGTTREPGAAKGTTREPGPGLIAAPSEGLGATRGEDPSRPNAGPLDATATDPLPPPGGGRAAPWIVLGGAGALAVAGGILFAMGRSDLSTVEDAPPGTPFRDVEDAADRAPVLTGVGGALIGAGVAGLAAGLVWILADSPADDAREDR